MAVLPEVGRVISIRRRISRRRLQGAPSRSPVDWAQWGEVSRYLALTLRPKPPAVLILSMPRSGSSWIGDMLALAAESLYLREPVTQSDGQFFRLGTVFPLDHDDVRASYQRLADKAFQGWPDFDGSIVRAPERWALHRRPSRRLVIKEVNPLACRWYLSRYRPRVIHLVRHPAAVTLSNQKKGFLAPDPAVWAWYGEFQARALREQSDALADYPDRTAVTYEALCADPLGEFRRLFDFAGLTWTEGVRETIRAESAHSARMIGAWRGEVSREIAAIHRDGYRKVETPWYRGDEDW